MARMPHAHPILLLDDSHEDLFLTKRMLARAGLQNPIVTIDVGEEALSYLKAATLPQVSELRPLVMFCDVKMPGLSGFDVLKWIRDQPALAGMPVYMLSGADLESDRATARTLGAAGYLVKFPTADVFKQLIDRATQSADGPR